MGKLRQLIRDYIARIVIETFSPEYLRTILKNLVTYLKAYAEQTENIVDDWIIEALENIVNDPEKIQTIYKFIKRFVIPADGICAALPNEGAYAGLTQEIVNIEGEKTVCENIENAKAIGFAQWLQLIELVVPIIIDAYERFFRDKR